MLRKPPTWIPGVARARAAWPDARVDALIDTYVGWREESEGVKRAYERWTVCGRAERDLAYAAYRAALDREEKAAAVYELATAQLAGTVREPHEC